MLLSTINLTNQLNKDNFNGIMYKGLRVTTVLPAYDEAKHIGQVIETLPSFVDHMLVVDDCGKDGNRKAALMIVDSRLVVLDI